MGLLADGRLVSDAAVRYEFFQVDGPTATKRSEAAATYRSLDPVRGIYVAQVEFDRPGAWGVQVSAERPGLAPLSARSGFEVLAQSSSPVPGQPAIPSRNPTAAEVANLSDICSAQPPCEMHALSIEQALARQQPLVVTFSTPGYCTSQLCGPVLNEIQQIRTRRGSQATFVHVEIYKDPRNLIVADAVNEWGLRSEPWVYLIDRRGIVAARIESITTAEEIEAALVPLI
jgi:hypothetical protein